MDSENIPKYFRPSVFRFVIFSILTLGGYVIYWSYRNWSAIKIADKSDILPLARSLILILYLLPLYQRMAKDIKGESSFIYRYSGAFFLAPLVAAIAWGVFLSKNDIIFQSSVVAFLIRMVVRSISPLSMLAFQSILFKDRDDFEKSFKVARGEIIFVVVFMVLNIMSILKIMSEKYEAEFHQQQREINSIKN